ncbi:unnamed protein product [Jaminaea pallidilutea]
MSDHVNGSQSSVAPGQNGAPPENHEASVTLESTKQPVQQQPQEGAPTMHATPQDSVSQVAAAQSAVEPAAQPGAATAPVAESIAPAAVPIQPPTSDARSEPVPAAPQPTQSPQPGSLTVTADAAPPSTQPAEPASTPAEAPAPAPAATANPYDLKEEQDVGAAARTSEATGTLEAKPSVSTPAPTSQSEQVPPSTTADPSASSEAGRPSVDAVAPGRESVLSPLDAGSQPATAAAGAASPPAPALSSSEKASDAQQSSIAEPPSALGTSAGEQPDVAPSPPVKTESSTEVPPQDVVMSDAAAAPSTAAPAEPSSSEVAPSASSASAAPAVAGLGGADAEPPAKRQRMSPDAANASGVVTADATQITMTAGQIKFAQNSVKALKQRPDALPFLQPVDPVALNIPQYPQIITQPMDLGTVDVKLAMTASAIKGGKATEKTKSASQLGLDLSRDVYHSVKEWEDDVRLVFANCIRFNGPDHVISQSAKTLETVFEKQLNSMPVELPPTPTTAETTTDAAAAETKARRPSNPVPTIRRSSSDALGRPKREIHPPPPRDLPYSGEPQSAPSGRKRKPTKALTPRQQAYQSKVNAEDLKFCMKLTEELIKQHSETVWPFIDLVDKSMSYAPVYYEVIKQPVAIRTVQDKIRKGDYEDKHDFIADMRLLFKNCYTFNEPGSDAHVMGKNFEDLFNDKIKKMPKHKAMTPEPEDDLDDVDGEYDVDDEDRARLQRIADLEEQLAELKREHKAAQAKAASRKKAARPSGGSKKKAAAATGAASGAASSSKARADSGKRKGSTSTPGKKSGKVRITDDGSGDDENDVRAVSWEQKEELARKITQLSDERLDGALQIISEDKPPNANEDEEIELDIEDLTPRTLYKLYRYVVKPKKKPGPKPGSAKAGGGSGSGSGRKSGGGGATGGKKRKNLDEEEEAARIARLQEQLQSFDRADGPDAAAIPAAAAGGHDDLVQSESSSGEDESDASDSDY